MKGGADQPRGCCGREAAVISRQLVTLDTQGLSSTTKATSHLQIAGRKTGRKD